MFKILVFTATMFGAVLQPMSCERTPRSCPQHEELLEQHAPQAGWDTARMSRIMWRESRCQPEAYNRGGRAAGLLQITPVSYPYLRDALGEWVDRWTLMEPEQNVRAAAALFDYWAHSGRSGYLPWRT